MESKLDNNIPQQIHRCRGLAVKVDQPVVDAANQLRLHMHTIHTYTQPNIVTTTQLNIHNI